MSRYRRGGGGRRYLLVVLAVLVATAAVPSSSFTTGSLDRGGDIDVVDDPSGVVGLDVAPGVTNGSVDPLVNVTNNFGRTVTVTVTLQDGSDGDLYVDGTNVGDEASVTLDPGQRQQIDVKATSGAGSDLAFDGTAAVTGFSGELPDRSTTVE